MNTLRYYLLLSVVAVWLCCCSGGTASDSSSGNGTTVERALFGTLSDGREVYLYTLRNDNGFTVKMTNYGGIITSIVAPDRNGKWDNVVLGFDSLSQYLASHPHVGPVIGRYSGWVAGGKFSIDGQEYRLEKNAGENHLHGGKKAFDKVLWQAEEISTMDGKGVKLVYESADGEEGYPGKLNVSVSYVLTEQNALVFTYEAETDKKTHVNLTNHLYFNLSGFESPDILKHELTINAGRYAVPGEGNIPTGELRSVEGTALDFILPRPVGGRIGELEDGYDHNYVIKSENDDELYQAATVYDPDSGRLMEVQSTHTGLEFASANWLNVKGAGGKQHGASSAFLLYPQHLPDTPNRPEFPSTLLEPGQKYFQKTVYAFYTR